MQTSALLILGMLAPACACAAGLTVLTTEGSGRPLQNAVVTVNVPGSKPVKATQMSEVRQRNKSFDPPVLAVGIGRSVRFPNDDPFLHHVYSFSEAKTFELDLYSREQEPVVEFDRAGVVVIGCNIHDEMRGYIYVTHASHFGVSGRDGRVDFGALPAGTYELNFWHPRVRSKSGSSIKVLLKDDDIKSVSAALELRRDRLGKLDEYERGDYE